MLRLDHVSKSFGLGAFGSRSFLAVDDVSLRVAPGEVVSLIGESGSGKSTIGKMILRLLPVSSGSITFQGEDVSTHTGKALKAYYRRVQGVFQDPFSSYNPIFTVDHALDLVRREYLGDLSGQEWRRRLTSVLETVSINAGEVLGKYPHQLSGGQLQRLLIARALMLDLRFLVADEIISMLDASTRIDVLNLLGDLKTRGLGILFITHDLSLGNYISDRTVILRHGAVVEMGATGLVFGNPCHPYTRALLSAVPQLHARWGAAPEQQAPPVPGGSAPGRQAPGTPGATTTAVPPAGRVATVERSRTAPGRRAALVEIEDDHFVAPTGNG